MKSAVSGYTNPTEKETDVAQVTRCDNCTDCMPGTLQAPDLPGLGWLFDHAVICIGEAHQPEN
jgi:hypothetical protein